MARRGLERCDVALLIVDSEQGVTQGDAQIASYAEQSGRSVIIVMNKWDLAVEAARKSAERDAATSKGQARRAAHDRRTEAAAKFSTTAQSRAKFKAGEARAAASKANRGKDSSRKRRSAGIFLRRRNARRPRFQRLRTKAACSSTTKNSSATNSNS